MVQPSDFLSELIPDIISDQDQGEDPTTKPKITVIIPTPIGDITIIWENNGDYLSETGQDSSVNPQIIFPVPIPTPYGTIVVIVIWEITDEKSSEEAAG